MQPVTLYELLLFSAAIYGCLHVERNYSLSLLSNLYLTPTLIQSPSTLVDGSWLQLKLKRCRLQRRLHAHLTLLHVYYLWHQIKSILLLNIRITKQTNPNPKITLRDVGVQRSEGDATVSRYPRCVASFANGAKHLASQYRLSTRCLPSNGWCRDPAG